MQFIAAAAAAAGDVSIPGGAAATKVGSYRVVEAAEDASVPALEPLLLGRAVDEGTKCGRHDVAEWGTLEMVMPGFPQGTVMPWEIRMEVMVSAAVV